MADIPLSDILGGGGSSAPVNSFSVFYAGGVDHYVAPDGSEWLKTGVVNTDYMDYPNATKSYSVPSATTATLTSGYDRDFCYLDGYFWAVNSSTKGVEKFNLDGTTTGDSFTATEASFPVAITTDGDFLYVSSADKIYIYNTDGTYINNFTVSFVSTYLVSLAYDGTYFWGTENNGDTLYQFDATGVNTGLSIAATGNYMRGCEVQGEFIWSFDIPNACKKYSLSDGTFAGDELTGISSSSYSDGIAFDGTFLYAKSGETIQRFDPTVGFSTVKTSSDLGLPYYIRIK